MTPDEIKYAANLIEQFNRIGEARKEVMNAIPERAGILRVGRDASDYYTPGAARYVTVRLNRAEALNLLDKWDAQLRAELKRLNVEGY